MTDAHVAESILAANRSLEESLPFDDTQDFEDARRGFVGRLDPCVIRAADGRVVWDNDSYKFLDGPAPNTVNPSLWRQSILSAMDGLFEVTQGVYQVRGLDLSNISFIEGETGVLVIESVGAMSVNVPVEVVCPRPAPTWPAGPRWMPAPYM